MSDANESAPEFDSADLYREDTFTDRKTGTIRRLQPVDASGAVDESRPVLYLGSAQVMTAGGPIPLNFELPGESLEDACKAFASSAQEAVEEMAARLEEMRRDQASQLVVPGQGGNRGSGILGV